jgi:capsular exopolysaccharide synthesis family protein
VSEKDSLVMIENVKFPMNRWVNTKWGVLQFASNPRYKKLNDGGQKAGTAFYFSIYPLNDAAQLLAENFKAAPLNKQNTVVKLVLKDPAGERGEMIVEEIVNQYYKSKVDKRTKVAAKTLQFIEERMKLIGSELSSLENNLQTYRTNSGSIDMGQQGMLYLQRIEENDKQLSTLSLQQSALDELERYVTSKGSQEGIAPSIFSINDPILTKLIENLYAAEAKYTGLKATMANNNPLVLSVKQEIENTRSKIMDNIQNQRRNISANQRQLENSSARYSSMLNTVPKKEKDLVEVSRDMNTKRETYGFLLQKWEEIAYSMNSSFEDAFYVDNPTSTPSPVSPNSKMMYLLGLAIPFVTGIAIVFLKENMSGKILYIKEVESLTRFPVIGEINYEALDTRIPLASPDHTFMSEQFSFIRNSFRYVFRGNKKSDRILVTSSIEGEGKSFFSCNFAISLAKTGKKVLLIELDFYHPQVSESFGLKSGKGMIDYLSHAAMIEEIIVPVENIPNLSIIQAGTPRKGSSALLASGKIDYLLQKMELNYDAVIIDSPPLKAISDALTVAPKCNIIMYLVRHNVTPAQVLRNLDKDMHKYNIKNLAIVFNGVKKRGFGKFGYGHSYGYGYDIKTTYDKYTKERRAKAV